MSKPTQMNAYGEETMDSDKEMKLLGERLRDWRIRANQTQKDFAARIGVSIPTLRRMERGDPATSIGAWVAAILVLDRRRDVQDLLREQKPLFDDLPEARNPRKRVRKQQTAGASCLVE